MSHLRVMPRDLGYGYGYSYDPGYYYAPLPVTASTSGITIVDTAVGATIAIGRPRLTPGR